MRNRTYLELSVVASTGFVVYLVFISIAGTVANFMVAFVIFTSKHLHTKTNLIIFNLAIADFLVAAVAIPLRVVGDLQAQSTNLVSCRVVIAFTILFDGLSRISIVLVTLDRFIAVKFSFWYAENFSKRFVVVLVLCSWTLMGLFAILLLSGVGLRKTFAPSLAICCFSSTLSTASVLVFTTAFCLVPVLAVIPLNYYLLKTSHRHMRQIHELQMSVQNALDVPNVSERDKTTQLEKNLNLKQRKVIRMVFGFVGLFIILVTPISVIDIIETARGINVSPLILKPAVCLIYSNSFLNVFIYAGYNSAFREALRDSFRRLKTYLTRPCADTPS